MYAAGHRSEVGVAPVAPSLGCEVACGGCPAADWPVGPMLWNSVEIAACCSSFNTLNDAVVVSRGLGAIRSLPTPRFLHFFWQTRKQANLRRKQAELGSVAESLASTFATAPFALNACAESRPGGTTWTL